eukprot:TRINITY_DN4403_c0_g1_i1.p1 TRINITY_DN4403_c0_g1~~TRINITY_DN4403_c0_g1_i1.p1  ORF type:complete len:123 (+),score=46.58 TRINITY_DN4403_c0_g1_i1:108-476(+)
MSISRMMGCCEGREERGERGGKGKRRKERERERKNFVYLCGFAVERGEKLEGKRKETKAVCKIPFTKMTMRGKEEKEKGEKEEKEEKEENEIEKLFSCFVCFTAFCLYLLINQFTKSNKEKK